MTPARKLRKLIEEKRADIAGVESVMIRHEQELEALLKVQHALGLDMRKPAANGRPGRGRPRSPERHEKLMNALRNPSREGLSVAQLSEESGYPVNTLETKIKMMFKAGEVERVSRGRYRLKALVIS